MQPHTGLASGDSPPGQTDFRLPEHPGSPPGALYGKVPAAPALCPTICLGIVPLIRSSRQKTPCFASMGTIWGKTQRAQLLGRQPSRVSPCF